MTIDERLDKLVERHEALVATIELDHREFREQFALTAQAIADLRILAESHEKRLDDQRELMRQMDQRHEERLNEQREQQDRLDARVDAFSASVEIMRDNFDARLKRLEGPQ